MPRRLVLLALAIIAILVLANQGSHHATTNGPASPSTTIKPAEAKIGIAVQRGPVCLGDMEAQEYFVRVRVVNTGNVKEVIHLVAQPGFSIKSEWVVMVLSSLVFALLHSANALSGMPIITVLVTILFTFGFGICMYLTLRVTGNLIWPMILHALYDPTLFLSTGGIDQAAAGPQSPLLQLAGPANMIYILIALVALIVVRGRAQRSPLAEPAAL